MAENLFDFGVDPYTGLRCAGYEEDGEVIILNQAPGSYVQSHLDFNDAVAENARDRVTRRGSTGGVVARIPEITWWRWRQEWKNGPKKYGVPWNGPHTSFLARKLRETDNKRLRFAKI